MQWWRKPDLLIALIEWLIGALVIMILALILSWWWLRRRGGTLRAAKFGPAVITLLVGVGIVAFAQAVPLRWPHNVLWSSVRPLMQLIAVLGAICILLYWLNCVRLMKATTRCGIGRAIVMALTLPIVWIALLALVVVTVHALYFVGTLVLVALR